MKGARAYFIFKYISLLRTTPRITNFEFEVIGNNLKVNNYRIFFYKTGPSTHLSQFHD